MLVMLVLRSGPDSTKSICGSKAARREARRNAAKTGRPSTRIRTAQVTARVRSKPKDVVRSKRMNRCRLATVPSPGTKE